MPTVNEMVMLVITISLILLAVVVWNSVFKSILQQLFDVESIPQFWYALGLVVLAAVLLYWYSSRKMTTDQPVLQNATFILVSAFVFLAAVALANWVESWLRPLFTFGKPGWNEFLYAVAVTLAVAFLLYAFSPRESRYKRMDSLSSRMRVENGLLPTNVGSSRGPSIERMSPTSGRAVPPSPRREAATRVSRTFA